MVSKAKTVYWDKAAKDSFRPAINYIRKESVKNAENVRVELLQKINE